MKNTFKKAFTLIELIIVIAIIAILAVTAFLMLTKWMGKSRDSRRINDISAINSALQIYTSDASLLPLPDSYSGVYDTGFALARYQGNFTDNIASQLSNISKNIKDPQNGYYGYSVTFDRKQYQLKALCESTVGYITNQVYAAAQTTKMQGNYAGFVITYTGNLHSLWNVPSLFLFSGTAITSGVQYVSGNNNFLQDNKTTDNIYPVQTVDVSNLYNSTTSDDAGVYTNIINTYSGTNNVTNNSGATAIVQSAAGGVSISSLGQQSIGCNAITYIYSGHSYSILSPVVNGGTWSGASSEYLYNNKKYVYSGTFICNNGTFQYSNEIVTSQKQYMCGNNYNGNNRLNKSNPNLCEQQVACSKSWACNGGEIICYITTYAGNTSVSTRTQGGGQFAGSSGDYGSTCGRVDMN